MRHNRDGRQLRLSALATAVTKQFGIERDRPVPFRAYRPGTDQKHIAIGT